MDGYPKEFERRLCLRDGRLVDVRPIRPADAPRLAAAIRAADSDTLHRRFMGAPPHVTPALLAHLTQIDYHDRFALVAFDPRTTEGIAIGRYEPSGEATAELAVAVVPKWRRAGLATALVRMLAEAAAERGIHAFTASYLAENRPVAALFSHADGSRLIKQGVAEITVALDRCETHPRPAPAERQECPDSLLAMGRWPFRPEAAEPRCSRRATSQSRGAEDQSEHSTSSDDKHVTHQRAVDGR